MQEQERIMDDWLKYAAWIKASGIHSQELLKAYSDFWFTQLNAQLESFKNTIAVVSESIEDWKKEGREELLAELVEKVKDRIKINETAPVTDGIESSEEQWSERKIENNAYRSVLSLLTPTEEVSLPDTKEGK